MNKKISTKDMVVSALLIAIGILIPMIFTGPPFKIVVGPYSATLMAHVPVILAMFTAVGTTIGFLITTPLIVAVRAASHIVFAIVGAILIKRKVGVIPLCLITGVIHAVLEGLTVLVFYAGGFAEPAESYSANMMVIITAVGTMAHR